MCRQNYGILMCLTKLKCLGGVHARIFCQPRANLRQRKIIEEEGCILCSRELETRVHALWNYAIAKDVWVGSLVRLQKRSSNHQDVLQLFHELLVWLSKSEFELFLVKAWLIWNQRNSVTYGGKIRDPRWLNKRALDYLTEFQQSQV